MQKQEQLLPLPDKLLKRAAIDRCSCPCCLTLISGDIAGSFGLHRVIDSIRLIAGSWISTQELRVILRKVLNREDAYVEWVFFKYCKQCDITYFYIKIEGSAIYDCFDSYRLMQVLKKEKLI